jgi:hypothetical protein
MRMVMRKYAHDHAQVRAWSCASMRMGMRKYAHGHAQICAWPCTNLRTIRGTKAMELHWNFKNIHIGLVSGELKSP